MWYLKVASQSQVKSTQPYSFGASQLSQLLVDNRGTHTYFLVNLPSYGGNVYSIMDLLVFSHSIIQSIIRFHGNGPVNGGDFIWSNFTQGSMMQWSYGIPTTTR